MRQHPPRAFVRTLILPLIVMVAATAFYVQNGQAAAITKPGDENYLIDSSKYMDFVYSQNEANIIKDAKRVADFYHELYQSEFNWKPDQRHALILASPKNQVSNAFVTPLPHLKTVFFGGGSELVDYFSAKSWLHILFSHETSHMYQINPKKGFGKVLHSTLGNTSPASGIYGIPLGYMAYPNMFGPTFLTEGNATFNEARFGNGGRLYSGAHRANLLVALQDGQLTAANLINDRAFFPYGREKYIYGGYFFNYLAERFGTKRTNRFFVVAAKHYVNPLLLNRSFKETFGKDFYALFRDFQQHWMPTAAKIIRVDAEPFAISEEQVPLSLRANGEVYAYASPRATSSQIYNINKNGAVTAVDSNAASGRVFDYQGRIVTATSGSVDNDEIRYGLFDDGYHLVDGTVGRYYYDLRGKNALYSEINESFFAPRLKLNGRDLGFSASSGMISNSGEAIFFRQDGKTRTLYHGEKPMFSYSGYYGFPVGESPDGGYYFIGPTEFGSSLFLFQKGEFFRLHTADTITDARVLGNNRAVVSEYTSNGYLYKVVELESRPRVEKPFSYNYFFENSPEWQKGLEILNLAAQETKTQTNARVPAAEPVESTEPYNSFLEWKFDGIDVFGSNTAGGATFRFSDPLDFHKVTFGGIYRDLDSKYAESGETDAFFVYTNARYPLNWGLTYDHDEIDEDGTLAGEFVSIDSEKIGLFFDYPLFERPRHLVAYSLSLKYVVPTSSRPDLIKPSETYEGKHSLYYLYSNSNYAAFDNTPRFFTSIGQETDADAPDWKRNFDLYGAAIGVHRPILKDSFVEVSYQSVFTDAQTPEVEFEKALPAGPQSPTTINRVSLEDAREPANEFFRLDRVTVLAQMAFPTIVYPKRIPFGLRYLAPTFYYSEFYGTLVDDGPRETLFHEVGLGMVAEILFIHKIPFKIYLLGAQNSLAADDNNLQLSTSFSLKQTF